MKRSIFASFLALTILFTGCKKDKNSSSDNAEGTGSVSVGIKGYSSPAKAGNAIGNPSQELENTVHSFTVYVFNANSGILEQKATFAGTLTGRIEGLSVASAKKIVALVNEPAGYPQITRYSDFEATEKMISLSSQVPGNFSVTGLFMSGEVNNVALSSETTVSVEIHVKRVVAKVRLGTLKIIPESGASLSNFALVGFSIQKARTAANVFGSLNLGSFQYGSGILHPGSDDIVEGFLYESYSLPSSYEEGATLEPQAYFYVFPNDGSGEATRFTLRGTYNGIQTFFPFLINDRAMGSGANDPDGMYIQRNKIYTLNVTLRKIAQGGDDPNTPNGAVALDIEIVVDDWEGELIQEVEW